MYYFDDVADLFNSTSRLNARVKTKAAAVYSELNFEITGDLLLIGGLRYSHEKKHLVGQNAVTGLRADARKSWQAWTPRVALRYSLDPVTNVYASFSRGFKSGAFNAQTLSSTPVNQETVNGYEIGYKRAAGGFMLNSSAFYYDYKNLQLQASVLNAAGQSSTAFFNAATAEIYGADLETEVQLAPDWRLYGGAAWTHARYTHFPGAILTTPRPTGGNLQGPGDASGNQMVRTPKLTLNGGVSYRHDFTSGTIAVNADAYYNNGFYWDAGNRFRQGSYALVNASVSWSPAGSAWRVSVWGRNLTNKTYAIYGTDTTFADAAAYARPRSIGVAVNLNFGT